MNPFINIASRAALNAGRVILRGLNKLESLDVKTKGRNDFVSEIDFQAERAIIKVIQDAYPEHAILAEETGEIGDSEFVWIIDPLDGSINYLHGFPVFGVSIALQHKGKLKAAVIYDPMRDEMFTASKGEGAFLNQRRIKISNQTNIQYSLIGTGFPFRNHDNLDRYLEMFKLILPNVSGVRRPGAACLDLAYLAAGRLDGFWEIGLSPWDIAAGVLLITEAGGVVTDFAGKDDYLTSGDIVAGNLEIQQKLLKIIKGT